MKYMKITKSNWKGIVKRVKKENPLIYTERSGKVRAKNATFKLLRKPTGKYTIIAKRK